MGLRPMRLKPTSVQHRPQLKLQPSQPCCSAFMMIWATSANIG